MNELVFLVKGSAQEPYEVIFIKRNETTLAAYCSCPAGQKRQYCKHRFSILDGIEKGIVSDNSSEVTIVEEWLKGTDLEAALEEMHQINSEAEEIKKSLSSARKNVASAMHV